MGRISFFRVALNIITCLVRGVHLKIFCTSLRISAQRGNTAMFSDHRRPRVWRSGPSIPSDSSILSHSSSTKCFTLVRSSERALGFSGEHSAWMRPGVPTTMCGRVRSSLRTFSSLEMLNNKGRLRVSQKETQARSYTGEALHRAVVGRKQSRIAKTPCLKSASNH